MFKQIFDANLSDVGQFFQAIHTDGGIYVFLREEHGLVLMSNKPISQYSRSERSECTAQFPELKFRYFFSSSLALESLAHLFGGEFNVSQEPCPAFIQLDKLKIDFKSSLYECNTIYSGRGSYHSHHGQVFNAPLKPSKFPFFIGVELETLWGNPEDRKEFQNKSSNWFYVEEDSSLGSSGTEIITVPLRYEDAKSPSFWMPLISKMDKSYAWRSSACGLHVHISKTAAGKDEEEQSATIGRLIFLYNYTLNRDIKRKVYGRDFVSYASSISCEVATSVDKIKTALRHKDVRDEVEKAVKKSASDSRYSAINIQNSATIEFRQGKASICADRICAVVEFCQLCVAYSRVYKNIYKYTQASFEAYIKERMSLSLKKYLYNEEI